MRGAHDLARELLAVRRVLRISHECAAVVVDDVVLVLAGPANPSIGNGEHVIIVHIIVPGVNVSGVLKIRRCRLQTTCGRGFH